MKTKNTLDHQKIEKRWRLFWEKNKVFKTNTRDFSKPKYYVLDMFPYTSGEGLHVGHVEGYTATDIISRMKRMQGYNVLHPMGFDSFGLPSEQYAIKTGKHPEGFTLKNIKNFITQLKMLGFDYDWSKQVYTCDPNYYKWTQWIFIQMFKDGLAKYIDMPVNWCPRLGTVLANDEVINGKSERGGHPVIRKNMKQWVMDIPAYADRLLEGLKSIDWPESTKKTQKKWIGKSVGANIIFKVDGKKLSFDVFTTRPDTLFGVTYCVLSPEHPLVNKITTTPYQKQVQSYQKACSLKSEFERTEINKNKTGVFTGSYAINPINNRRVPIWISDYVLVTYGTGAIMAVPAHDERDYQFAKKFNLDIIPVIKGGNPKKQAYTGEGAYINSGFLNDLDKKTAIKKVISWLEENGFGSKQTSYKIREWIFARQRYWGEPIPVVHMEDGSIKALKKDRLPLVLPNIKDYKTKNGQAPLDNATKWKNVVIDGKKGVRETSTMPGSAGSSWYFLRYIDPNNKKQLAGKKLLNHWLPIDLYLGGPEHSVGHLLYSRFWNNYLFDKGIVPVKEPFKKLRHQGMILGSNNEKMSKSKGNVINPNDIVNTHGADALRLYLMFMGPLDADKAWNIEGLNGIKKFIDRVWRLYVEENKLKNENNQNLEKLYNQTVKKVTEDYEKLSFNTAISQMMIFVNAVYKENIFPKNYAKGFLRLLNPICPFFTEEIWQKIFKKKKTIAYEKWPKYDKDKLKRGSIDLIIQVNNKTRDVIKCPTETSNKKLKTIVLQSKKAKKHLEGKKIEKTIIVPNKLINIIAK